MSSNLISKITGVPTRIVEGDLAQFFPEEFEGVSKDAPVEERFIAHMAYSPKRAKGRTRGYRVSKRLEEGRAIKPCGKECHAWGDMIIKSTNHISMINSKELVDDEEFLLHAARITPNPRECSNFFYEFVNEYLKKSPKFRMNFLKSLFLNIHILTRRDILVFVDAYDFNEEYEILTKDEEFKKELKQAFKDTAAAPDYVIYDGKSWGSTKRKYNNYKIASDAKLRLKDLLSSFEEIKKYKISKDGIRVD